MYRVPVVVQLLIVLFVIGIAVVSPDLFTTLTKEDSVIEWLTALLFMTSGVMAGMAAVRSRRRRSPWLTTICLILLGQVLLVVGFEEISWGQRIFAFKTPEGLREINMQGEFNLHNIHTGLAQKVALFGSFAAGVCLPLLCVLFTPVRRLYGTRLDLRSPSPLIAVPCLLGYALCMPEWLLPAQAMGLTYVCCGAFITARLAPERPDRSWPDALVLAAGIASALALRVALEVAGPWSNGWMELGEECFAMAAGLLAYSTLSAPTDSG